MGRSTAAFPSKDFNLDIGVDRCKLSANSPETPSWFPFALPRSAYPPAYSSLLLPVAGFVPKLRRLPRSDGRIRKVRFDVVTI